MAEPTNVLNEVSEALQAVEDSETTQRRSKDLEKARRAKALTLKLAGFTDEQIGERLNITQQAASRMLQRALDSAQAVGVERLRTLENERLDRAQLAIWPDVLKGDQKAINTFLRISSERSKLNGMYAPQKVELAMSIKTEMEQALSELEELVMTPVTDETGEVTYELDNQYGADAIEAAAAEIADEASFE